MTTIPLNPERFLYAAIGDVHGDLPALAAAVDAIRAKAAETGREAFVLALGDAIDRGPSSAGCAAFIMRLARGEDAAHPGTDLCFVRGDHDVALSFDEATGRFSSAVEPAEWAERLNDLPPDADERHVAREWIDFVREAPSAILLRNDAEGVLLSHGAVPHADLLPRLATLADADSPECGRDFTWCRVASSSRKLPNRSSLFCDVGLLDVADFLDWLAARAGGEGFRIVHFVHGHEHTPPGCDVAALPGGRKVWSVTSFRSDDDGILGAMRPAALLLNTDAPPVSEGGAVAPPVSGSGAVAPRVLFPEVSP